MEHPLITKAIQTGYPHGEPDYPRCPVCNCECEEIYVDEAGDIFGCDCCVKIKNAWEVEECF